MTIAAIITNGIGPGGTVPLLLTDGFWTAPPQPVIIIDSGDPGVRKKKRFEDEAEKRRRNRAEIVAAYEWAVEGKPRLAAEVAVEFAEPVAEAQREDAPEIDFTRLAESFEQAERLLAAYREMQDEEDVEVLLLN